MTNEPEPTETNAYALPDAPEKVTALLDVAWELRGQDAARALGIACDAHDLALILRDDRGRADSLQIAGVCLTRLGRLKDALVYLTDALRLAQATQERRIEAACQNNIGIVHYQLGDFANALEHYTRHHELCEALQDSGALPTALNNIGTVHAELGEYETALERHLAAARLALELGDDRNAAIALSNAGREQHHLGRDDEALDTLQDALTCAHRTTDRQVIPHILANLADALLATGRADEALAYYELAVQSAAQLGDRSREADGKLQLGQALLRLDRLDDAETYLNEALELAVDTSSLKTACGVHEALARLCEAREDYAGALRHHREYHRLDKDITGETVRTRIQTLLTRLDVEQARRENEELRRADQEKAELLRQLRTQSRALEREAQEDPLTRLHNRRSLERYLHTAFHKARAGGETLALVMLDIDHFKSINDRFTHLTGDEVLQELALLLKQHCRKGDFVARYGGEEFAVLLPHADAREAHAACEKLRLAVQNYDWARVHPDLSVTISLGAADTRTTESVQDLMRQADARLYDAKRAGRNQSRA